MSSKKPLQAYFAAGKAIALADLGLAADVSLGAPSMTPWQVAATVIGGSFRVDLPEVSVNGAELLALIAGSEAVKQAVARKNLAAGSASPTRLPAQW
jgi:hypothetical protein